MGSITCGSGGLSKHFCSSKLESLFFFVRKKGCYKELSFTTGDCVDYYKNLRIFVMVARRYDSILKFTCRKEYELWICLKECRIK